MENSSLPVGVTKENLQEASVDLYEACLNATAAYEALKLIGADKELPGFERNEKKLKSAIAKAKGIEL